MPTLVRRVVVPNDSDSTPVHYSPLLVAYVAGCVALALWLVIRYYAAPHDWVPLVVSAVVIMLLARTSVEQVSGQEMLFSATVLLHMGLVITFGAAGAIVACTADAVGTTMRRRIGWFRLTFNLAMFLISSMTAWAVYTGLIRLPVDNPWRAVLAGIAAGIALWLVNNVLVAGVFAARSAALMPACRFLRAMIPHLPYYVLYGMAAAAFPILYGNTGTAGILMLIGPLLAAQLFLIALERNAHSYNTERQSYVDLVERQNVDLETRRVQVVRAYDATLIALTNALDARDKETEGHSRRVVEYSRAIGRELGLADDRMRVLAHGALLHDIGKIGVPDNILLKPSKLTPEEWQLMRQHPAIGEAMIRDVDVLREARRIILHHHERWNGSGYPRGLRGAHIDQGARIFAVADTCDAITQDRPYRRGVSLDWARAEIARCRGTDFDPDAVDAFLSLDEGELQQILQMRSAPGLDLLIDSEARARYLAGLGLGTELIPA
ncbi:MAG TPA: HD-GYP domain-containing protein [Candidatus Dormibacteraeota bacterium]